MVPSRGTAVLVVLVKVGIVVQSGGAWEDWGRQVMVPLSDKSREDAVVVVENMIDAEDEVVHAVGGWVAGPEQVGARNIRRRIVGDQFLPMESNRLAGIIL